VNVICLPRKIAIISIHDISPEFTSDILAIIEMLEQLNLDTYSALIIPYYLNEKKNDIRIHKNIFNKIFREGEPILHGFTHETSAYTNEFTLLNQKIIRQLLVKGKKILQQVSGKKILGFVPPKWILSRELLSILKEEQFQFTTNFFHIIPFEYNEIFCPAVNFLYSYSSLNYILAHFAGLYARYLVAKRNLIRIVIHPQGFNIRKNLVESVLKRVIEAEYDFMTYGAFLNLVD